MLKQQQQPKHVVDDMKPKIRPISTHRRSVKQMAQDYENIIEPPLEFRNPAPTPRKSVKQIIQDYEQNIIAPPVQFRDEYKPVAAPRKKKPKIVLFDDKSDNEEIEKPKPIPRTIIKETKNALKNHTKSFEISIKNSKDPLSQMQDTRLAIGQKFEELLKETNGFKFNETLKITFSKLTNDGVL